MSSSVSTNQGPRESSKSLTELFSEPSSSSSRPQRLAPIAGSLNKTISVEQKKKLLRKLCYPRLVAKIEKSWVCL